MPALPGGEEKALFLSPPGRGGPEGPGWVPETTARQTHPAATRHPSREGMEKGATRHKAGSGASNGQTRQARCLRSQGGKKRRFFIPSLEGWPVGPGWVPETTARQTHPAATRHPSREGMEKGATRYKEGRD